MVFSPPASSPGRPPPARRWAPGLGDSNTEKKPYFLLGETYQQLGRPEEARYNFTQLQQIFYPDAEHAPELLMAIDVRSILNLKA